MPHKRSVSPPRSSNRTCGFPASGFPTGFIARNTAAGGHERHPCSVPPWRRDTAFSENSRSHAVLDTTLSYFRADLCLSAPLRPLPSSRADLPRLRVPLSRRAVPTTPVDRSRCICRLLPRTVLPSPRFGRVGVHNFPFEACSGFTHVTARQFARPPRAAFVAGLRYGQLPNRTACQLPGQPTITRVGLSPTR